MAGSRCGRQSAGVGGHADEAEWPADPPTQPTELHRSEEMTVKILRNLTLAALTALAVALPVVGPSTAHAQHATRHSNPQQRIYWVYYRTNANASWVCYGGYYQQSQAEQAVTYFRYYGYDSYYR
jgi:hypothetical protein